MPAPSVSTGTPNSRFDALLQAVEAAIWLMRGEENLRLLAQTAVENQSASHKRGREEDEDEDGRAPKRGRMGTEGEIEVPAAGDANLDANMLEDKQVEGSKATRPLKPMPTRPTPMSVGKLTMRIPSKGAAKACASRGKGHATKNVVIDAPAVVNAASMERNRKDGSMKAARKLQKEDPMDKGEIVRKNVEPRWVCGICKKYIVPMRANVGKHLLAHDPERQLHCEARGCTYSTIYGEWMRIHMASHDGDFVCDMPVAEGLCGFTCRSCAHLTYHKRSHDMVAESSTEAKTQKGPSSRSVVPVSTASADVAA